MMASGSERVSGMVIEERNAEKRFRILIVDPLGYTLDYDEALVEALRGAGMEAELLTATWKDRRGKAVHEDAFFLRGTGWICSRLTWWPEVIGKAAGAIEYLVDVMRLAIKSRNADVIVHWQWVPLPLWVELIFRVVNKGKVALTAHNVWPHDVGHTRWREWQLRRLYNWPARIVVHGETMRRQLLVIEPKNENKVNVIPAGLQHEQVIASDPGQLRDELGIKSGEMLVGFMGLIRPYKGLEDLVTAWELLVESNLADEMRLLIAGDWNLMPGEQAQCLRERIRAMDNVVMMESYLDERRFTQVLSSLDVLVTPYRSASQSGIVLGAFRFGVPVIATRTGDIPSLFPGTLADWLVDPLASEQIAEKLKIMRRMNSSARAKLRRETETVAEGMRWSKLAIKYRDMYEEMV